MKYNDLQKLFLNVLLHLLKNINNCVISFLFNQYKIIQDLKFLMEIKILNVL